MVDGRNEMTDRGLSAPAVDGLQNSATNSTTTGTAIHHQRPSSPNVSETRQKSTQWYRLFFGRCLDAVSKMEGRQTCLRHHLHEFQRDVGVVACLEGEEGERRPSRGIVEKIR